VPQFSGGSGRISENVHSFPLAYAGEDPPHSGTVVGNLMKCEQAQHAVGDTEYYVTNDQETGRFFVNFVISKRAMQESDLLTFHLAIFIANPRAVGSGANSTPRRLEWLLES
jgi:beta-glucosidase